MRKSQNRIKFLICFLAFHGKSLPSLSSYTQNLIFPFKNCHNRTSPSIKKLYLPLFRETFKLKKKNFNVDKVNLCPLGWRKFNEDNVLKKRVSISAPLIAKNKTLLLKNHNTNNSLIRSLIDEKFAKNNFGVTFTKKKKKIMHNIRSASANPFKKKSILRSLSQISANDKYIDYLSQANNVIENQEKKNETDEKQKILPKSLKTHRSNYKFKCKKLSKTSLSTQKRLGNSSTNNISLNRIAEYLFDSTPSEIVQLSNAFLSIASGISMLMMNNEIENRTETNNDISPFNIYAIPVQNQLQNLIPRRIYSPSWTVPLINSEQHRFPNNILSQDPRIFNNIEGNNDSNTTPKVNVAKPSSIENPHYYYYYDPTIAENSRNSGKIYYDNGNPKVTNLQKIANPRHDDKMSLLKYSLNTNNNDKVTSKPSLSTSGDNENFSKIDEKTIKNVLFSFLNDTTTIQM